MKIKQTKKTLQRGKYTGYENELLYVCTEITTKNAPQGRKQWLWKQLTENIILTRKYEINLFKRLQNQKIKLGNTYLSWDSRLWTGLKYTTRRRNTLATQTGEDNDFIHMGEGNTGENNQGLGMTSDQGHKRKGKWPETRVTFQNKTWISQDKKTKTGHPSQCDRFGHFVL